MNEYETNVSDIIIIGGGPVGLYASFYSGIRQMKIKLIESLSELGGQITMLYPKKNIFDIPGYKKILGENLVSELIEQATQFNNLDIHLEEIAQNIEYLDEKVENDIPLIRLHTNKGSYLTKSLLICIGGGKFIPKKLPIQKLDEFENKGLFYFIKNPNLLKDKDIAIVGGGDSAFAWAINLKDIANKIYIIHRSNKYNASEYFVDKAFSISKIEILPFYEVIDLEADEKINALKKIYLQNKDDEKLVPLDVQYLILNIGFSLDMGLLNDWNLDSYLGRNIYANRSMKTSKMGIWVAGDVANFEEKLKLISVGFSEAVIAVNSIKNYIHPNSKFFPGHSTHFKKGTFRF